mmetsp:Transcript_26824/g.23688  ORF Transcript_26824/g.23688 Transcript_26824/m.23688 type:complete len:141 (-) Transcript_26824:11-433(-)
MSSKNLNDLHLHNNPSSNRIKILPWHPTFYKSSKEEIYKLNYLDITGRDLQEKYMLMLLENNVWSDSVTNQTSLPEFLGLYSSSNIIAMKKAHKTIHSLEDNKGRKYKFQTKYFVGIDDRRPIDGPKGLVIEYLVVYKLN